MSKLTTFSLIILLFSGKSIEPLKSTSLTRALAAGAILALATVAFFWQILLTPHAWMPAGGGDLVPFLYPNYHFAAQHLSQGVVPLWNPHLYSGLPFAADPQSGLFYPINLIIFLTQPNLTVHTLEGLAVFHFWLAGFGMFLFLQYSPVAQRFKINFLSALTGAIAFELSDLFITHFGNLNMIAVAAWLPLVVLFFQKAVVEKKARFALATGCLLAVATLAGHIQITLFILLTLALYTLWHTFFSEQNAQQPPGIRERLIPLTYLFITLLITVGLSSLWLIPTIEMSQHTLRTDLSYQESAAFALNPGQLIGLLIPNYFGRDPALHWGPWDRVETGYLGVLTLLLALISLVLRQNRSILFFAALALISFLLALGDNAILHGWLSLNPGFGQFRAPARYILLLDFALATLAAIGLSQLMTPLTPSIQARFAATLKAMTWVLGGLTVISLPLAYYALLLMQDRNQEIFRRAQAATNGVTTFALLIIASLILLHLIRTQRLQGFAAGLSALIIISLDLFSLGSTVDVGYSDPTTGFDHPEAVAFLQADQGINRIEVTTDVWHLWQPDAALLHQLYDAWGVYNPLTLAAPTRYWQQVGPRSSSRYNFLGLKHIVASKAGAPADGNIVPIFDADPDINIYLNLDALPRILFVPEARIAPSHEAAWEAIQADSFDPQEFVVIEAPPNMEAFTSPATQPSPAQVLLQRYDLHTIQISIETETPGYLVLSDAYYPGWQATIDGQPAPLYRANYAFRAVPVMAGTQIVEMTFKPLTWMVGVIVSGVTLLGVLLFFGFIWIRNR